MHHGRHLRKNRCLSRTARNANFSLTAGITGDMNPLHLDAEYAAHSMFGKRIAPGMLVAWLISAVLGTQLPRSAASCGGGRWQDAGAVPGRCAQQMTWVDATLGGGGRGTLVLRDV
jgi:acyl dehydratase